MAPPRQASLAAATPLRGHFIRLCPRQARVPSILGWRWPPPPRLLRPPPRPAGTHLKASSPLLSFLVLFPTPPLAVATRDPVRGVSSGRPGSWVPDRGPREATAFLRTCLCVALPPSPAVPSLQDSESPLVPHLAPSRPDSLPHPPAPPPAGHPQQEQPWAALPSAPPSWPRRGALRVSPPPPPPGAECPGASGGCGPAAGPSALRLTSPTSAPRGGCSAGTRTPDKALSPGSSYSNPSYVDENYTQPHHTPPPTP